MANTEEWLSTLRTVLIEEYIDGGAQLERPLGRVQHLTIEGHVDDALFTVETEQVEIPEGDNVFTTDPIDFPMVKRNWFIRGVKVIDGQVHLYLRERDMSVPMPGFVVLDEKDLSKDTTDEDSDKD